MAALAPDQKNKRTRMKTIRNYYSMPRAVMVAALVLCLVACSYDGRAAVSSYTDFATYQSLVGPQAVIGFTEVPLYTTLSDEYSTLGVRFVDGDDRPQFDPGAYLKDNFGLEGGPNENRPAPIVLQFAGPLHSLGLDFPGVLRVELFSGSTSLGSSDHFGTSGPGHFGGVVSDTPFDRAIISRDWLKQAVYIDNLYVTPVPEPSMWALLVVGSGMACLLGRKRKTRLRYK